MPLNRAKLAVVLADGRPIALVFPASRRVVPDRLRKLLGADEVRDAPCDEVDRILGDLDALETPPVPDRSRVPLLIDATLLSARAMEIPGCGGQGTVRLSLEHLIATAYPDLGFFTEPDPS